MPYRKNGRGDWRIKRSFGTIAGIEVGKLDRPSGTTDEALAIEIDKIMSKVAELGEQGAHLLAEIRDDFRTPLEVYNLYSRQEINNTSIIKHGEALKDAWKAFLKTARRKNGSALHPRTIKSYDGYLTQLLKLKPDATVRDLPKMLEKYRLKMVDAGKAPTFNKTRMACLAFARNSQTNKQYSDLWRDLAKVELADGQTKKTDTALPVWDVAEIIKALPQERMRNVAWALATTGMRIGEYASTAWSIAEDRVVIHGTKTRAAERVCPMPMEINPEPFSYHDRIEQLRNWVTPGAVPLSYATFNKALKKASGERLTPHDLRHCTRLWHEEAGITDLRSDMYFGHKPKGLKERYARHKLDLHLEQDTQRLIDYIKANMKKPKEEKKKKVERLKVA